MFNVISTARLSSYQTIFKCDKEQALKYYYWNQALSAELYVLLHNIEICLRNRIHTVLSQSLSKGSSDNFAWYESFDFYQMKDGEKKLTTLGYKIKNIKRDLNKTGKPNTPQNIISNLEFGKWKYVLKHKKLKGDTVLEWRELDYKIFPHHQSLDSRNREKLLQRLDEIRLLRNRIGHLEPVWKFGKKHINGIEIPAPNDFDSVLDRLNKEITWATIFLKWLCEDSYKYYIDTQSYKKLRTLASSIGFEYFSI